MEYFEKKITYLRGLCDGSDFDENSKEGERIQIDTRTGEYMGRSKE